MHNPELTGAKRPVRNEMTNEVERVVMLPCPFCGHKCDLSEPDVLYPTGIFWCDDVDFGRSYCGRDHKMWRTDLNQCWQINCATVSGGCGANIIGDSKDETIAMWQRRAT